MLTCAYNIDAAILILFRYVGVEHVERYQDWLYAGCLGLPTEKRLMGGKDSAWNTVDTWSMSTQYDVDNSVWVSNAANAQHAGGLFWDGVYNNPQYQRFEGSTKRNEAVKFFFRDPAVIKIVAIVGIPGNSDYAIQKFNLERWDETASKWETVSKFFDPTQPNSAWMYTGLTGQQERAHSWRLLFPADAIAGSDVPHINEMIKFTTERNSAFPYTPDEVTLPVKNLDWSAGWKYNGIITGGEPTNDRIGTEGATACPDDGYCTWASSVQGSESASKVMNSNYADNDYWRAANHATDRRESFQWQFPKKAIVHRAQVVGQTYNTGSTHHGLGAARLQYWDTDDERWIDVAQVRENQNSKDPADDDSTVDTLLLSHNGKQKKMLSRNWRILFPWRAQSNNGDVIHIVAIDEIRYAME